GRVVIVTGGGSGLGEAMCQGFAREGGRVAVLDIHEQGAQKVAEGCTGEAAEDLGPVEVLVNNAGIARRNQEAQDRMLAELEAAMTGGERTSLGATSTLSDEEWDRMIRVH